MDLATFRQFTNEPILNPWSDEGMTKQLMSGIESAKAILHKPHRMLIGEKWVEGEAGGYTNANPNHRDESYGPFPIVSNAQANAAMEYAAELFQSWRRRSPSERAQVLRKIRQRFDEEKWTLMGLLMLEVGKTALEAYAEWAEGVDFLDYYANCSELYQDEEFLALAALQGHRTGLAAKPLGVGVSLPPFNFPCAIFTGMWAAPTVMGNVMVIKSSPRAPGTGTFCAQIFQQEGAPVQLLVEGKNSNNAIGKLLVEHPDISIVTFTGSRRAGMEINKAAALSSQRWVKRVVAEMGGCDFIAVHDVENMGDLLDAVQASWLGFQGQKCSALSRLIVKENCYDQVRQALVDRFASLELKDVVDPDSFLGGVIDERAQRTIAEQCEQVKASGGRFLRGGGTDDTYSGFGVAPGIHEGLAAGQKMASEEIFGPIFGLYKAKNFDEMVTIANGTPYALTGSLFTQDKQLKGRVSEFTSGNTYLNRKCTGAFVGAEPFGGWYGSGTDDKAGHWSHMMRFVQWQTVSEKL